MITYLVYEEDGEVEPIGFFDNQESIDTIVLTLVDMGYEKSNFVLRNIELNKVLVFDEEDSLAEDISSALEEMVKEGIVDYRIDENGDFVFEPVKDKNNE